jgi:D-tyrosyl-tRNA(Tyr) deacylase
MEGDSEEDALLLAEKISKLRIFNDENGKMNLSVNDVSGEVLVVSNFTLGANYAHGNRPDFLSSSSPDIANRLYDYFILQISSKVRRVATGKFGADMITEMSTDGPVTIIMHSDILKKKKN